MRIFLLTLSIFFTSISFSQNISVKENCSLDIVSEYIFKSNSTALSNCFSNNVEIITPTSDGVFSKAQAEMVLKSFFREYPSDYFNILQKGTSKGDSKFFIGEYRSKDNKFDVYCLTKNEKGKELILQLHFEKE
ncbi:MAG: DUF4783 domain-containing protein [Bacteroidales bacterium]